MTRLVAAALVAIALIVTSVTGHAAPRVDHYEAGKRLFARQHYAEALEQFRRELSIAPRPEVLYSIAQTQRLLGDCASAITTSRAFLAGQQDEPFADYARL